MVKNDNQVTRVTKEEKAAFAKAAVALGWKDASSLIRAVITMTIAGTLEVKAPDVPQPTVNFKGQS